VPASAGVLLYRLSDDRLQVLLVHPGGPFWAKRDEGAWSIPKGEYDATEEPLEAARREFAEELGSELPTAVAPIDLGEVTQKSGKRVRAFAVAGDIDPSTVRSNMVEIVWPPRSGRTIEIPEVDRAEWFALDDARAKINAGQVDLLTRLQDAVGR
jgi:predicted NUDIX family NTP pyrophosphohydrolase